MVIVVQKKPKTTYSTHLITVQEYQQTAQPREANGALNLKTVRRLQYVQTV